MTNVSGLELFEEIRFIVELVVAEHLLTWSFAKKRSSHMRRSVIGFLIMVALGVSFVWSATTIYNWGQMFGIGNVLTSFWYVLLALISLIYLKMCYEITWSDLLFLGICGYAIQHLEYVAVNELLARGIWPGLQNYLLLYIFICVVTSGIWYWIAAVLFLKNLKACDGLIYEDKWSTIIYFFLMLIIVFISSFLCQAIYVNKSYDFSAVNYLGAASDFFTCTLILVAQYSVCKISSLNKEKEIIK